MDDHENDDSSAASKQRYMPLLSSGATDARRSTIIPAEDIERYRPTELPDDPRERAQMLREFEQRAGAYLSTKAAAEDAQRDGDPMRLKAARRLSRHLSRPLVAFIEADAQRSLHKPGTRDRWLKAHYALGAEALANCTIAAIVSVIIKRLSSTWEDRNKPVLATKVSREIGHRIAAAVQMAEWQRLNPALFGAFQRGLDEAGATPRHREKVLAIGLNTKARSPETASAEFLEATAPWPEAETAPIGRWLLDATVQVTKGAISLRRDIEGSRKGGIRSAPWVVELAPKAVQWLKDAIESQALRATNARAMVCPPREWSGPHDGGFLLGDDLRIGTTSMIRGILPVRKSVEDALGESHDTRKAATPVFTALNALQETPFAINEAVHVVAREAAASGLKLDDLPDSFRLERVPKEPPTGDSETDKALFVDWKRKEAAVRNRNARNVSKVVWSKTVLSEASELRDLEIGRSVDNGPLWFVHRVDSRGRMYPAGNALNPHGSDLARSLLRFHRGKPIGSGRGPYWLAAQVAKAFGADKRSWDDRVQWTHDNEGMIRRIASDPLGHRGLWEEEADKLWAALAAAHEWTAYLDSGRSPSFATTLPIFIDGTCNGLQHFAAMSGDTALARLVNLEPGNRPEDIYREVAAAALADITMRSKLGTMSDRRAAHLWLRIIDADSSRTGEQPCEDALRKPAKSITMTKPYGSTFNVILKAVREFFDDNVEKRRNAWGRSIDDQEAADLRGWLAKRMEAALKGRTDPADRLMEWLQKAMRLLCDHGVADKLDWHTPSGFPWRGNLHFGHTKKKVKTKVGGKTHAMTLAFNDTSKFDSEAAVSAVPANLIQSLDAAALQLAINEANSRGVTDMMAIHDCIGGLAPDMDIIADAVRVGFVKCHEAMPLQTFREAVLAVLPDDKARAKLRPLPDRGEFDVRRVLGSEYLFC